MLDEGGVEILRALVRDVLQSACEGDPRRLQYREEPGPEPGWTLHFVERPDTERRVGLCVAVQPRAREGGEAVRRAVVSGHVDYRSSMTVFGNHAEQWKIRRWVDDLLATDGVDWR
jgi:hypothetical protein